MASEDHRIYYPKKIIKMAKGIDPRGIKKGIVGWQYNNISGNAYPQFFRIYDRGVYLNASGVPNYSAMPQPVNKAKKYYRIVRGQAVYQFEGGSDIDLSADGNNLDLSNVVDFYEPTMIPMQNR